MRINLAKLREEPFIYDVNLPPSFLMEGVEEDLRLDAAVGRVVFHMVGNEILAEGEIRSAAHGPCARCLAPATAPVAAPVHLYWWPRDRVREESKIADVVDPAEPDYGVYEGETLDPDEDLREILLVEVPGVMLCREDCKGLCPGCGVNRNEGECACPPEKRDEKTGGRPPSWKEQLRNLKFPPE